LVAALAVVSLELLQQAIDLVVLVVQVAAQALGTELVEQTDQIQT